MEYFTKMCRDIYFCTEEYSPSHFAVVNCILGYLLGMCSLSQDNDEARAKFAGYYTLCISNFETVIDSFNLCMEPSFKNVLALALGVSQHSFLRWTFN